jgi:hypothetical protein
LDGWMSREPGRVELGLSLFSATRHLEHIADRATSAAESVVFLTEGEHVATTAGRVASGIKMCRFARRGLIDRGVSARSTQGLHSR